MKKSRPAEGAEGSGHMKIGLATIYGDVYARDRVFDPASCTIGENLLVPGIRLKEHLEARGHSFHTVDLFEKGSLDRVIFQDIGPDCLLSLVLVQEQLFLCLGQY